MEDGKKISNFIWDFIDEELAKGIRDNVYTRFPPEPNGYLHIGHAKAIYINFTTAQKYSGKTNLRFDDTNPAKEDTEFVDSIQQDIKWLGYNWNKLCFGSDYFHQTYLYAIELIKKGLAYVDDLTAEDIKNYRGTLVTQGQESPYRNRGVEENLALFTQMKEGIFADGEKVLRAKIDMDSPNVVLRDPVIYRILHAYHHNTRDEWCIYPLYDFAHPIQDAIEGVTYSLCSLEFENNRPLYDWVLNNLDDFKKVRPRQIEFARLNLENTVMSKRFLKRLIDEGIADGWDDPRLPTLCGLRRRGVSPEAIRNFCEAIGISKSNSEVEYALFEHMIRDDLKPKAKRVMAVLDPVKVVITNYEKHRIEYLPISNNQDNEELGERLVPFGREIYIEREDFMEVPPNKYHRLYPGNEVRLMGAYFIKCEEVIKDANGDIIQINCTYDEKTKNGLGFTERKVKGTIHWVEVSTCEKFKTNLYEQLLLTDDGTDKDYMERINPQSLKEVTAYCEPCLKEANAGEVFQFVRNGYFAADSKSSKPEEPVFNRTVSLKSSYKVSQ
ncbi:MAG: glutamine--tRNA ligase/YqeY domain fusion protein [Eubacteriaceae bacterium]